MALARFLAASGGPGAMSFDARTALPDYATVASSALPPIAVPPALLQPIIQALLARSNDEKAPIRVEVAGAFASLLVRHLPMPTAAGAAGPLDAVVEALALLATDPVGDVRTAAIEALRTWASAVEVPERLLDVLVPPLHAAIRDRNQTIKHPAERALRSVLRLGMGTALLERYESSHRADPHMAHLGAYCRRVLSRLGDTEADADADAQ